MVVLEIGKGGFMKTLFATLLNIATRTIEIQLCHRQICFYKISPIAVERYNVNGKSRFDQLATASSSAPH